jgi:NADH-quinone oxidoreductase subunit F
MILSEESLFKLLQAYPQERRHTLAVFQDIQQACGYLPKEHVVEAARYLKIPLSQAYAIATFYRSFSLKPRAKYVIKVCNGMACHIQNGQGVLDSLKRILGIDAGDTEKDGLITVETAGCPGVCATAPVIQVNEEHYGDVTPEKIHDIILEIRGLVKDPTERLLHGDGTGKCAKSQQENSVYAPQKKWALRNVGEVDSGNIDDYKARGGYGALRKALTMPPEDIIAEVEKSLLRGRGGAGFPVGRKWRAAAVSGHFQKYVIMNGDEGDPGAFMDRSLMEGDPHGVLEGIIICALAIGATEGFLYICDEYLPALHSMKRALEDAENAGILGDSILGSGKSLRLSVVRGGGGYVCGETTALIESIEGNIGEPRAAHTYPTQHGLWNFPTVVNNVETFINIPLIIGDGGARFAETGTATSTGTKVFSLTGKVRRGGLIEVPMGITLREIIFDIGGGIIGGRRFKAVQTGGPSGGSLPESLLDVPVDFDTLPNHGSMMGSGGMIVMDECTCMVEVAKHNVKFLAKESCGACASCREGLRALLNILTGICEGQGEPEDLEAIRDICEVLAQASRCGLGKAAPNPVISTMRHFAEEYAEHITQKHCRAGVCGMGAVK